ncbi:MAG: 4Fe-4S ferredoxin, partial [candidate division WOR-3 bacterium]
MQHKRLKEIIAEVLKDVDLVIAYKQGFDPLHTTPSFITAPEQIDEAIWSATCAQNLAGYLPALKKKVGILVKGCDSRTIVQYIQEGLIDRSKVVIIGIPCTGVISA